MDGILILDKPLGLTSQQAVTKAKRMLGAKKAGHGGTLDPDAAGVLVIYLNQATRIAEYMLTGKKEYLAEATFGFSTDTQDATGQIIRRGDPSHLAQARIAAALASFEGTFEQIPPSFSALKVGGKPAYKMAREGTLVALAPRLVTVDWIRPEVFELGPHVYRARFRVACSKGTYIRTICHDLGTKLDVPAHMSALVRTRSGDFGIEEAHTFDQLEKYGWSIVLPPERGVGALAKVQLDPAASVKLLQGQAIELAILPQLEKAGVVVRAHDQHGRLLAICEAQENGRGKLMLRPQKVFPNAEVGF